MHRLRPDAPPPPDEMTPWGDTTFLDHYTRGLQLQSRDVGGATVAFERAAGYRPLREADRVEGGYFVREGERFETLTVLQAHLRDWTPPAFAHQPGA